MKFHNYTEYSNEQPTINLLIMIMRSRLRHLNRQSECIYVFQPQWISSIRIEVNANINLNQNLSIYLAECFLRIAFSRCYLWPKKKKKLWPVFAPIDYVNGQKSGIVKNFTMWIFV